MRETPAKKPSKLPQIEKSLSWVYDQITGDEDSRVCKDIPDSACHYQPRNFFSYLLANTCGKIADELVSARLTLPWLLSAVGAPSSFAGFLVPIREAGVLLPQLVVAAYIRLMPLRKPVWIIGAIASGIVMLLMALSATMLNGVTAGWSILALLVIYSLGRGLCSVSAKDVLGKTISKTRRGTLSGYSVAISSFAILALGWYLQQGWFVQESNEQSQSLSVLMLLFLAAALLWLISVLSFNAIKEIPGATDGGGNAINDAINSFSLLKTDADFRRFIILRSLLLSSALMPPFLVIMVQENTEGSLSGLGWLIIANGLAGVTSGVIWGKLSDYSSRLAIIIGSLLAGITGFGLWAISLSDSVLSSSPTAYALFFFLIALAHGGVRLGRKVYLIDMSTESNRSLYVALSNTVIGIVMLLAGSIGFVADIISVVNVVVMLASISLLSAVYASRMPNVSG